MKKLIIKAFALALFISLFSGCSKYYVTSPQNNQIPNVEKRIPVKVELTQTDWSIIVSLPDKDIKKNATDVLFDSSVFVEDDTSINIMKIDIVHNNAHGGAELGNAVLTGASFYLIPGVADSDVNISVSMNGIKSDYQGEMITAAGLGADSMIDKTKYTEESPWNLMKNLIKNAVDKFAVVYLEKKSI